ncbi:hypothetical protein [Kineococcus sp. SYSU DK005]|uniref:hypothetical protein n=1 Tax=Kineococcus sp. SYSU DK005 TaxID=3383126 RepID=UPI003D7C88C9
MPASSLIFLVIVLLWAAYLVPAAIRRRRHAADSRVGDRDSAALRVVVRQGSAPAPGTAAVPPASSRPVLAAAARPQLPAAARGPAQAPADEVAAPVPAGAREPRVLVRQGVDGRVLRRRRQLLGTVLGATVLAWVLALAAVVPAWAALLPTAALALVVAALRRHAAQAPARVVLPTAVVAPARAAVVEEPGSVLDELTAQLERELAEELAAAAVPAPRPEPAAPAAAGTWEPTEVPLPTYLLKPRARVVRPATTAAPAARVDVDVEVEAVPAPSVRGRRVIDVRERARVVNG